MWPYGETVTVKGWTGPSTDTEGRTAATDAETTVTGVYVAMTDFREAQLGLADGQHFEIVVAMLLGTDASAFRPGALVEVTKEGMAGTYKVGAVRRTAITHRVLCSREGIRT